MLGGGVVDANSGGPVGCRRHCQGVISRYEKTREGTKEAQQAPVVSTGEKWEQEMCKGDMSI